MLSVKKWYIVFFVLFLLTVLLLMSFNFIIDPFGAFGDKFLRMYDYDMFKNTRISKISYLEENYNKFDSYIIGGSKSGALLPQIVEKYYDGAQFYNLNMIGGKFYDYEHTIYYIVKNYKVKNIVFQISQLEANLPGTSKDITGTLHGKLFRNFPLYFYTKVLFQNPSYSIDKLLTAISQDGSSYSFYNIKTGSYNYDKAEKLIQADPYKYFNNKSLFPDKNPKVTDTVFEYNLEALKRIVNFCKEHKVNLLLITSPTYTTEIDSYPHDKLRDYMKSIADISDYWNFSGYNSINIEKTNFYNNNHFRVKISQMIMARIFNDESVNVPDDFGMYVTPENADTVIDKAICK